MSSIIWSVHTKNVGVGVKLSSTYVTTAPSMHGNNFFSNFQPLCHILSAFITNKKSSVI